MLSLQAVLGNFAGLRSNLREGDFNYGWVNHTTNVDSSVITFLGAAFNITASVSFLVGQVPTVTVVPVTCWRSLD